jgi:hypothetical protein
VKKGESFSQLFSDSDQVDWPLFTEPQHPLPPQLTSPQLGSTPRSLLMMMAPAHPTPCLTARAPTGQFIAQAPHSMHVARLAISAFPRLMRNTACGQTSTQAPQPMQASVFSLRVSPFSG